MSAPFPHAGGLDQPDWAAPWWSYAEKGAWHDFARANPELAEAITRIVDLHNFSDSPDPILSSGVQIEGLWLRVAELLRLVELERPTWHAPNCGGPDDWHNPTNGHCGDCDCIACHLATHR